METSKALLPVAWVFRKNDNKVFFDLERDAKQFAKQYPEWTVTPLYTYDQAIYGMQGH